jgi:membrane-bound inhibitor of C-type lysozyme
MVKKPRIVTGLLQAMALCVPALLTAACVPNETGKAAASAGVIENSTTTQPRQATYNCGEGGSLIIENLRTSVHLTEPDGTSVELPASPPTQQSRFGEAPYALVLEGNEALLMKNGKEPLTCKR